MKLLAVKYQEGKNLEKMVNDEKMEWSRNANFDQGEEKVEVLVLRNDYDPELEEIN